MPRRRREEFKTSLILFYLLVGLVFLADQFTKSLAVAYLESQPSIAILPGFFHFTLVYNKGIAFGLFHNHESLLLIAITASLFVLFLFSRHVMDLSLLTRWAFGLILGGALGNWIDRVHHGYVIDFLDFRVWPVFNVADTAISIGVGLYLLSLLKKEKRI
ncbi:MAG: signal peptidase II [Candidatus Omnitrophica bacterium]|nr:signal peptidase II [Candidatus Omnitrophota bacterium]